MAPYSSLQARGWHYSICYSQSSLRAAFCNEEVLSCGGHEVVRQATIATDLPSQRKRKLNGIKALPIVEMGGRTPDPLYAK
jgi:hypothetical protein